MPILAHLLILLVLVAYQLYGVFPQQALITPKKGKTKSKIRSHTHLIKYAHQYHQTHQK